MELEKEIEQLKKRIELLESIVLNNVHSESKKNEEKEGRDKTRYMFENKILPKNRFVLAVIKKYVKDNNPTFSELAKTFDKSIQGSLNVVEKIENAEKIKDCKKRYFMLSPLSLKGGDTVVVCTQWGIFNIVKFEKVANYLGYHFDKV